MPIFDAIATQTVRKVDHLEPAFLHQADIEAAAKKLKARRKKPNILIFLMDDVG
jgi:arylsulfatase